MKKFLSLLIIMLLSFSVFAQHHGDEKIQALKASYLTESLSLTPKEAEKFWPIYNDFDERTDALYEQKWCEVKNGLDTIDVLDEATANDLLNEYISLRAESLQLKREFITQLKTVISSQKILRLKKAEHDFHKILLEKYTKGK